MSPLPNHPCSPSGTYAKKNVDGVYSCTDCPPGYYRFGPANPINNQCKFLPAGKQGIISRKHDWHAHMCTTCAAASCLVETCLPRVPTPAGYRERTSADRTAAEMEEGTTVAVRSEIVACAPGTFSSWAGNPSNPETSTATRQPPVNTGNPGNNALNAQSCQPCPAHLHASLTGTWAASCCVLAAKWEGYLHCQSSCAGEPGRQSARCGSMCQPLRCIAAAHC